MVLVEESAAEFVSNVGFAFWNRFISATIQAERIFPDQWDPRDAKGKKVNGNVLRT